MIFPQPHQAFCLAGGNGFADDRHRVLFVGGFFWMTMEFPPKKLRVTLIQPSIPQSVIWNTGENEKSSGNSSRRRSRAHEPNGLAHLAGIRRAGI